VALVTSAFALASGRDGRVFAMTAAAIGLTVIGRSWRCGRTGPGLAKPLVAIARGILTGQRRRTQPV
jgi:hypothetical protein